MDKQTIMDALNYIGIDPKDFDLKDSYFTSDKSAHHRKHGKGHLYRVMLGCALLAKELQQPRLGLLAFCAAFLHDQNRESNRGDYNHGLRAANICFPKFNEIWDKYGLSPIEREYVRAACANHSSHDDHNYQENSEVTKIVSDADALDRCRFYRHGKLNPNILRYQVESRRLIPVIEEICKPTNPYEGFPYEISFEDFIDMATRTAAPAEGYNREYAPDVIRKLEDGQIFVFNNNAAGNSQLRTAVGARRYHGAQKGVSEGLTGNAYSIPTDGTIDDIEACVKRFISFAQEHQDLKFLVTKIGCGQAGYSAAEIAPLFAEALPVNNILLPKEFVDILLAQEELPSNQDEGDPDTNDENNSNSSSDNSAPSDQHVEESAETRENHVIYGNFLEDKNGYLWLYGCRRHGPIVENTIDLRKCKDRRYELVSGTTLGTYNISIPFLVSKNRQGLYAVHTLYHDTMGEGGIYKSITPGHTFKRVIGLSLAKDAFIVAQDEKCHWGAIKIAYSAENNWSYRYYTPYVLIPFEYETEGDVLQQITITMNGKDFIDLIQRRPWMGDLTDSLSYMGNMLERCNLNPWGCKASEI